MANIDNFTVEQFLDWLGEKDLENIHNHGVADGNEMQNIGAEGVRDREEEEEEEEEAFEEVDEGIEADKEDEVDESATLSRRVKVTDNVDAIYCTTLSFVKVPTEEKDFLLCQLCYWRYLDRCHPLTTHRQATVHKSTKIRRIPRLYCGVCECNLFVIGTISTCTQCNQCLK